MGTSVASSYRGVVSLFTLGYDIISVVDFEGTESVDLPSQK